MLNALKSGFLDLRTHLKLSIKLSISFNSGFAWAILFLTSCQASVSGSWEVILLENDNSPGGGYFHIKRSGRLGPHIKSEGKTWGKVQPNFSK